MTWELPARPAERADPLWFSVAFNLILAALATEMGALGYLLLKLAR